MRTDTRDGQDKKPEEDDTCAQCGREIPCDEVAFEDRKTKRLTCLKCVKKG